MRAESGSLKANQGLNGAAAPAEAAAAAAARYQSWSGARGLARLPGRRRCEPSNWPGDPINWRQPSAFFLSGRSATPNRQRRHTRWNPPEPVTLTNKCLGGYSARERMIPSARPYKGGSTTNCHSQVTWTSQSAALGAHFILFQFNSVVF